MNTTTSPQTIALIAARINRGDSVDLFGTDEFRTVADVALIDCMVVVEYADGTTARIAPHRTVEIAA